MGSNVTTASNRAIEIANHVDSVRHYSFISFFIEICDQFINKSHIETFFEGWFPTSEIFPSGQDFVFSREKMLL